MRYTIHLLMSLVVLVFVGCTSVSKEENITWPASTPYDGNAVTRQIYLDAYQDGYRAVMYGGSSTVDSMRGSNQHIRELGWRAGAAEAQQRKNKAP